MLTHQQLRDEFWASVKSQPEVDYQAKWAALNSVPNPINIDINRRGETLDLTGGENVSNLRVSSNHLKSIRLKTMNVSTLTIACPNLVSIVLEDVAITNELQFQTPASSLETFEISGTEKTRAISVNQLNFKTAEEGRSNGIIKKLITKNVKIATVTVNIQAINSFTADSCEFNFDGNWVNVVNLTYNFDFIRTKLTGEWRFVGALNRIIDLKDCVATHQVYIQGDRLETLSVGIASDSPIVISGWGGGLNKPGTVDVRNNESIGPLLQIRSAHYTSLHLKLSGRIQAIEFEPNGKSKHNISIDSNEANVGSIKVANGFHLETFTAAKLEVGNFIIGEIESLERFELSDANVASIRLNGTVFKGSVLFERVYFTQAPQIRTKSPFEFYQVSFLGCTFEDRSYGSQSHYRKLRHLMGEIGNEQDEQFFGSLELICRTKSFWNHPSETFFGFLYKCLNECGLSLLRPLLWLFASGVVFVALDIFLELKWSLNSNRSNPYFELARAAEAWPYFCQAVFRSTLNSLGALRLATPPVFYPNSPSATFTQLLQSLLATILWFFFIVGIRRRFKLK